MSGTLADTDDTPLTGLPGWRGQLQEAATLFQREPLSPDDSHRINQLISEMQAVVNEGGHDIPEDAIRHIGQMQQSLGGMPLTRAQRQEIMAYARFIAKAEAETAAREESADVSAALASEEQVYKNLSSTQQKTWSFFSDPDSPWGQEFNQMSAEDRGEFSVEATRLMADPSNATGQQLDAMVNQPGVARFAREQNQTTLNEVAEIKNERPESAEQIDRIIARGGGVISPQVRDALRQYRETGNAEHLSEAERRERTHRGQVASDLIAVMENQGVRTFLQNEMQGKSPEQIAEMLESVDRNSPEVRTAREALQRANGVFESLPPEQQRLIALSNLGNRTAVAAPMAALGEYYMERVRAVGVDRAREEMRQFTTGENGAQLNGAQLADAMARSGVIADTEEAKRSVALGLAGVSRDEFTRVAEIYADGRVSGTDYAELKRIQMGTTEQPPGQDMDTALDGALRMDYSSLKASLAAWETKGNSTAVAAASGEQEQSAASPATRQAVVASADGPPAGSAMEKALQQASLDGVSNSGISGGGTPDAEEIRVTASLPQARQTGSSVATAPV